MNPAREVEIAGVGFRFHGGAAAERELDLRYGRFHAPRRLDRAVEVELAAGRGGPLVPEEPVRTRALGDGARELQTSSAEGRIEASGLRARIAGQHLGPMIDAVVRAVLARLLLDQGGLLLHGSAVRCGAAAHVFVGPSGVGKSTVARLLPGERLCDEAVALVPTAAGIEVRATPYWEGVPVRAPLGSLWLLARGPSPAARPLPASRAAARLWAEAGPHFDADRARALAAAAALAERTGPRELTLATLEDITAWLPARLAEAA